MRNRGKNRALALVMALALLPGTAGATGESNTVTESGITVVASNGGKVTYTEGSGFTLGEGSYTISGEWKGTLTANYGDPKAVITVPNGVTADVTLNGVNIDVSGVSYVGAFLVAGTANITLSGDNTLQSGDERAGLEVPTGAAVTIGGTGSLSATRGSAATSIGGGSHNGCGRITITGGTVNTNGIAIIGGDGVIGGGDTTDSSVGTVVITGGTVSADYITGGTDSAGSSMPLETYIRTVALAAGPRMEQADNSLLLGSDGNFAVIGTITLPCDLTIPDGKNLYIREGATLIIPDNITLTVEQGATLTGSGTVDNTNGKVYIAGSLEEGITIEDKDNLYYEIRLESASLTMRSNWLRAAVHQNASIQLLLKPKAGYDLPAALTSVTMDGSEVPSTHYRYLPDGILILENYFSPTAPVIIKAEGTLIPTPVTGVTLDAATLSLSIGSTHTLQATVTPANASDKSVSWSSSDEKIASVAPNGLVTAVAAGTADITATTTDGGLTATCTVTVNPPAPPPPPPQPPMPPSGGGGSDRDDGPSPTEQAVSKVDKAKDGERVEIKLPSGGNLDGTLLEAAAGKDVTLEISAGKGVTWIVNGLDIPSGKLADLNLKVDAKASTIPVTVINEVTGEQKVMQLALSHNGEFPIPLTLRLDAGKDNAGLFANLYYYNETAKELEYQTTTKIGADGNADIPFAHASSYAVVIDRESHAPAAEPEPEWKNPFTDVETTDWYYEAVAYVHQQGLMVGTTDAAFGPNGPVTRAQVWTVLARMDGREVSGGDPWYAPAQAWAVANGVSDGTDPDGAVTREQLVTMLYRYAQSAGRDVSVGEDTNILSYDDALDVAEWAVPAFQWACGAGVVSGTGESTLSPQAGATRAQLAAILMRFLESA